MKRTICLALLFAVLCVLCNGCNDWMGGEYLSITPHKAQPEAYANRVIEVTSYTQLRNAVANLVRTGAEDGIISISAFNRGTIHFYVDTAISNVIENTAFGAYAVEKITYELGTNRGVSVAAFQIHYRSGYQPNSKITEIENAQEMYDAVIDALESFERRILAHTEQYEKIDVASIVSQYSALYPDRIVEVPEVTISTYPDKGAERIVEISFEYEMDQLRLQQMRSKVEDHFRTAELSVRGIDDATEVYNQLFIHLTSQYTYSSTLSANPVYRLFEKGEGDEKTVADVFSRICTRIGLGCNTVVGTKNGQKYAWNAVQIHGKYYNVDLLQCVERQEFHLLTDADLEKYKAD